ncbi:globin family protein [Haliangium sp.]|uniref:globin family protein n=1 Tax=Haliangium sp. TaxID=2663208 RepID=UPI003D11473A
MATSIDRAVSPVAKRTLDERTITLVQRSWSRVLPIADAAATMFYQRLFELDPSVRALFRSDMRAQKQKLMQTLGVAVGGLRKPAALLPVLEDLGRRHVGYMVRPHHYDLVGQSLLWALREGLGEEVFTAEVEAAWTRVYGFVASVMKDAGGARTSEDVDANEETLPSQSATDTLDPNELESVNTRPDTDLVILSEIPGRSSRASMSRPPLRASSPSLTPAPGRASSPSLTPPPPSSIGERLPLASDGPIDAHTIHLVQTSWARVLPISDAAAALFYDRLFELDPSLRALFKNDMRAQKKKLMQTLGVAVDGLRTPNKLVPVLEALGARHASYMVRAHHYDLVGQSLLWALHEGMGDDFTPEIEAAWTKVYGFVAKVMKDAAGYGAEAPAAPSTPPTNERPHDSGRRGADALPRPSTPPPGERLVAPAPAPAARTSEIQRGSAPSGHRTPVDLQVTVTAPPAGGVASALLLSVTCGTLVVAVTTGLLLVGGADAALFGVPVAAMSLTVVAFLAGYFWGKR